MSNFKVGDKIIFDGKRGEIINIFEIKSKDPIYHVRTEDNAHYKTVGESFEKLNESTENGFINIEKKDFDFKISALASDNDIINDIIKPNQKLPLDCIVISTLLAIMGKELTKNIFGNNEVITIDKEILSSKIIEFTMPNEIMRIVNNILKNENMQSDLSLFIFISLTTSVVFLKIVDEYFKESEN